MEFAEDSLDAVLFKLYHALEVNGQQNVGSRGKTRELISVTLNIQKPRARLSVSENRGKPFSALGELLWYLSGSNTLEFIKPYVPRYKDDAVNGILEGAYLRVSMGWAKPFTIGPSNASSFGIAIGSDELESKAIRVMQIARSALFHVSFAIRHEERKKLRDDSDEMVGSMPLYWFEDRWKRRDPN